MKRPTPEEYRIEESKYSVGKQPISLLHSNLFLLLSELDRICRKNNIKYTLWAGTALGAKNYADFIPWDDDADVAMYRADFNRFIKACKKDLDTERFVLESTKTSNCTLLIMAKLKLKGTYFPEEWMKTVPSALPYVFLDIVIFDRVFDCTYKIQKNISRIWNYGRVCKLKANIQLKHRHFAKMISVFPMRFLVFMTDFPLKVFNWLPLTKIRITTFDMEDLSVPFRMTFLTDLEEAPFHGGSFYLSKTITYMLDEWYGAGKWQQEYPPEKRVPYHGGSDGDIKLLPL